MTTDTDVVDAIAEILREPDWSPGSDFLDDIFSKVERVRDCSTRFCGICDEPVWLIDGGDWEKSRCDRHNPIGGECGYCGQPLTEYDVVVSSPAGDAHEACLEDAELEEDA